MVWLMFMSIDRDDINFYFKEFLGPILLSQGKASSHITWGMILSFYKNLNFSQNSWESLTFYVLPRHYHCIIPKIKITITTNIQITSNLLENHCNRYLLATQLCSYLMYKKKIAHFEK